MSNPWFWAVLAEMGLFVITFYIWFDWVMGRHHNHNDFPNLCPACDQAMRKRLRRI